MLARAPRQHFGYRALKVFIWPGDRVGRALVLTISRSEFVDQGLTEGRARICPPDQLFQVES